MSGTYVCLTNFMISNAFSKFQEAILNIIESVDNLLVLIMDTNKEVDLNFYVCRIIEDILSIKVSMNSFFLH